MGEQDDDKLEISAGTDEESSSVGDQIPLSMSIKPCTAGISFAVASNARSPKLQIKILLAMYEAIEGSSLNEDELHAFKDLLKTDIKTLWRRRPHEVVITNVALDKSPQIIDLSQHGLPDGIRLHVRSVKWDKNYLATITLLNEIVINYDVTYAGEQSTLFQTHIEVTPCEDTYLIARPSRKVLQDEDERSNALLYRDVREYAVGHICSAEWFINDNSVKKVATTWIPNTIVPATNTDGHSILAKLAEGGESSPLSAKYLALADTPSLRSALLSVPKEYEKWIELQEKRIPSLPEEFRDQASLNMGNCRKILQRLTDGANAIVSRPISLVAFRLANMAMLTQYEWKLARQRKKGSLEWRPFQMGFFLLAAESVVKRDHPDRDLMDLLWFPTGGGKTEAYLGLIAYLAFYRRLNYKNADMGAGVAAMMRYTLRTLTTQQFERATAMILACEAIRLGLITGVTAGDLGSVPISIGLWVGSDATPKSYTDARASLNGTNPDSPSPKQVIDCPACGASLLWSPDESNKAINVSCINEKCIFFGSKLPICTVDEDIYKKRPTLIIGTVDKFAQIVRYEQVNVLFGIDIGNPPDLILQDELHLISGPLGTIASLYEVAIDRLFSLKEGRPKVIGSTATIRRASEQVKALFDRTACQFPPPAIDANDSGFAIADYDAPGRCYVAVTTAGRSAKFTLQNVSASLLQSALSIHGNAERDPYWTLVTYFNSLRELGGALVLMQDDVTDTVEMLATRRDETMRSITQVEELTSRRTQAEVRDMLKNIAIPSMNDGSVDVLLATNMLSVGIDIPRLGLMVVNGQPKGIAEYIQATSRVGRGDVPGLIVSVLNNAKARDRSHYETFSTWHTTLYRDVEATSVTPFASRARDRALHAVLVALIRHLVPNMLKSPKLDARALEKALKLIDYIVMRAKAIDPEETAVGTEARALIRKWQYLNPRYYWNYYVPNQSLLQDAERAVTLLAMGRRPADALSTMNNMRSVEPSTRFKLKPF